MIQIITDSTCDINKEEAAALGIHIVPLTVRFGNEEYLDGFTLSNEEFYQKLESCEELPVTSQPSPIIFKDLFMKYTEVGDQILGIFISSQLSGTFQSASIAAEMVRDECPAACIELIDSKSVSIGTSLLIREALRMRRYEVTNENNSTYFRERRTWSFTKSFCSCNCHWIMYYSIALCLV